MAGIVYQNKDTCSKFMAEHMKGKSLAAYGLDIPKIVAVEPTNLPMIEANELRIDNIFKLEDGSYAIVDYESAYKKKDKVKYLSYITRITGRYLQENKDFPFIHMVVIYTADVERKTVQDFVDLGASCVRVEAAFLSKMDGDAVLRDIASKLGRGEELDDTDMMRLMVSPLSHKGAERKEQAVMETIDVAEEIPTMEKQAFVLSGMAVFCDKVVGEEAWARIRRRLGMTILGRMFEEEKQEAIREAEERATQAERVSAIRSLMKKLDISAENAMEMLSLPEAEKPRYLAML